MTSRLDLRARAHDASHVLLYPQAIAVPRSADDVARLLRACAEAALTVTFRSGGTSLSGQAVGEGVLADVRHHFDAIEILDDGLRVRVQPGVTVDRLNAHLAPYGRRIGPDPASSRACTVGGVIANNSSGMACGTHENSYQTLESVQVVLASGTVIDTGAPDANERLAALEPDLYKGLIALWTRIRGNLDSVARIKQQFAMKNTMGYGLNAFLDYSTPADILAHLLVGSEGTLGFVASAVFRTVPVRAWVQTGLLVFDDLQRANAALPGLVETGAATLELMDAASLRVGQSLANCPPDIAAIEATTQAALLIEYQTTSAEELAELVARAQPTLADLGVPVALSADPATRDQLWVLRKGLYTAVASARRIGTTALLEDVVVPVAALGDTCLELTKLFDQFAYPDSVIFGHAKDGNIHFMITDRFERELDRYARFTEAMVELVLGQQGSLKAEHGTGRIMAPFVRRQYGDELYEVMCEVKRLFDPWQVLNAGVVISDDPTAHLKHIKVPMPVDPLVDACVECGYCEPVCPARTLTLTPRQRITAQREIVQALAESDTARAKELQASYLYEGIQTCAADGMCATACPVNINTGVFIKKLRAEQVSSRLGKGWASAARHWAGATHLASFALSTGRAFRGAAPVITAVNQVGRRMMGEDLLPLWSRDLPRGGRARRRPAPSRPPVAVYLPACVNAMFGPEPKGTGVQRAFESLCARVGLTLVVPGEIDALCCGTPWTSKGLTTGTQAMADQVIPAVRAASDQGRLPIICDASSCTEGFQRILAAETDLTVVDAVQFVAEQVLPHLGPLPKLASITLHPTCSSTALGLNPHLVTIATAIAEQVHTPVDAGCCAFAGDRGLLHPELTAAATRTEATQVAQLNSQVHASCNRTCEIGLSRATGEPYRHILEILATQIAKGP
jgi:D-lactate dehydrogenase